MLEIKIQNRNRETILLFMSIEERAKMIEAINNCLNYPVEYPTIDYRDKSDHIIFTSVYLKESLIVIPNPKS